MISNSHTCMILGALLWVTILAACTHTPPAPLTSPGVIPSLDTGTVRRQQATHAAMVRLPRFGAALLTPVVLHTHELPLDVALSMVIDQMPQRPGLSFANPGTRLRPVTVSYQGILKDLLPQLEAQTGLAVSLEEGTLVWRDRITRVFEVARLPGQRRFKIGNDSQQTGNSQSASSGSSQSGQSAVANDSAGLRNDTQFVLGESGDGDMWRVLEQSLEAIMGDTGRLKIQPMMASVIATGSPTQVREVGQVIEVLNRQLSRQVHLDIKVVQVVLDREEALGIDWQAVRSTVQTTAALGGQMVNLEGTLSPGLVSLQLLKTSGKYAGSEILIKALQSQGRVKIVTEPQVMALNYQVIEQRWVKETVYLASTSAGSGSGYDSGGQVGINPGTVTEGITLLIQPNIGTDHVLLHTSITIANLEALPTIESAGQTIQTPILSKSVFNEQTRARDGETLVISGLRQVSHVSDQAQPYGLNWLAGNSTKQEVIETVLLVTPRLVR